MRKIFVPSLLAAMSLTHVHAQDWHPGKMGEDAPGGRVVEIPSGDIQLRGVIYYPKSSEKTEELPAIIIVHGWSPYGVRAGEPYTYVAKEYSENGFIAMAVTLRGWPETGGDDDCGLKQPKDIAAAADWLSKQPRVDSNRIGLMGQSLGGQIVLSAAALTSSIRATAAYFPITDFRLWGVTTSLGQQVKEDYIYGMCAEEGTPEDRSPIHTAHKISGAVLLLHGDNDQNVVLAHSKLMYQRMREFEKDVTLYLAEGGGHGSGGPGWENHNQVVYEFFRDKMQRDQSGTHTD